MDDEVMVFTELWLRREVRGQTRNAFIEALNERCGKPTGLNEMTILGWETRAYEPRGRNARLLRVYHRVDSIAELGLGHDPGAAANWAWATEEERRRAVERRRALQVIGTGMTAALLPVGRLTQAAQLLGGRPRLDLAAIETAEGVATHLAISYLADPNAETVAAAVAHARTLTDRLRHASLTPEVRPRLAAVAADAASLVANAAVVTGQPSQAGWWCDRAVALAREAGDRRLESLTLTAIIRTASAYTRPGTGDRSGSLAALKAAASLDGHLPAAGRAYVNGLLARELAGEGDDLESGRALERTLAAITLVGREEPGWGWWSQHAQLSGWDGARARVYTGLRPLYLGRHREAVPLLESAVEGTSAPGRRATLHQDLAYGWVGLDEPDRACAATMAAWDLASAHGLQLLLNEVRELRSSFPLGWASLGCVVELDERLTLA
ncbi:MAG: hypothetical protein ACRDYA_19165 [Egibacteraceae bacterium]